MEKIKIGVFGAGRGLPLCQGVLLYPEAELVAVCDAYEPLLDRLRVEAEKASLNVTYYTNFDEFIQHDMDAVILANYATEHAPYAIRCLKAGKHVLSELMACETMAQAVELVEAVEQSGKVYAYAENCCYMKPAFEMWRKMKKGELGEMKYGEGEYIHNGASGTPWLTHGDKNHWRNRSYATFYASHSLGPLLMMSGHRPVRVVGFETPGHTRTYIPGGSPRGGQAGIEMVVLDNNVVLKSVHGGLKREPAGNNWTVYCDEGYMASSFMDEEPMFYQYKDFEGMQALGSWERYLPDMNVRPELAEQITTHGGADFYATHFFIQKILGNPEGEWSIDIYNALDMTFCGLLAHRSVLNGNQPVQIPNFRNPEEREAYRNDHACCTPEVAGDQVLPRSSIPHPEIPDSVYDNIRKLFEDGKNGNGIPNDDVPICENKMKSDFYKLVGHEAKKDK